MQPGEDLGHGVRIVASDEDHMVVHSQTLDLGWTCAQGRVRGTAVLWGERQLEVVQRATTAHGQRWVLEPWREGEAMRTVVRLDAETVTDLAEEAAADRRARDRRRAALPLLPLLGLAPGVMQERWHREWGYPSTRATQLSAVIEIAAGSAGALQVMVLGFGGEPFLPAPLVQLAFAGPILWIEGLLRLYHVSAHDEARGSFLGLPALLFEPRRPPPAGPANTPRLQGLEQHGSRLELWSPMRRPDWEDEGTLRYRDQRYVGEHMEQSGTGWTYRFRAISEPGTGPALRLLPPPEIDEDPDRPIAAGRLFRTIVITLTMMFAPRREQELWARRIHVGPVALTAVGAAIQLAGGAVNLSVDLERGSPFLLLDLLVLGEGAVRAGSAAIRQPIGSVLGWPLRPLYRRWTAGERAAP
jgi:hypothetical protein